MVAVGKCFERRSQQWSIRRIRLPLRRTEVVPSIGAFQGRWPDLEITGDRSERRVGEQVKGAFETVLGEALLNRGNQPAASRAVAAFLQDHMLCRAGMSGPAAPVGGGGPVDVREKRSDGRAENSNSDQRQLER